MKQLHPRVVWLFFFRSITSSGILLTIALGFIAILTIDSPGFFSFITNSFLIALIIVIFLFIVFIYIWARLQYHFYRYELTQDSFRKELGIIKKVYVSIPYNRIQNIDIYRSIWARILGISELHIQTAGMSGRITTEGRLPGLSKEEAELLRSKLISIVGQNNNQGL